MNREEGPPNRGRGAAVWLIRIGAFLILSTPPLHRLYVQARNAGAPPPLRILILSWLLTLVWAAPSLLGTLRARPWLERATLVAFVPLTGLLGYAAFHAAELPRVLNQPAFPVPPWLAALPAAGILLALLGAAAGLRRPALAAFARAWLAGSILWVFLLDWNSFGFTLRRFYTAAGVAGAAMLLLGELARPRESSGFPPRLAPPANER